MSVKLTVEITLDHIGIDYIEKNRKDFFPTADSSMISIDHCLLKIDPTDNSFYLFKCVKMEEINANHS